VPQSGAEQAKQWEIIPNPKLKSLGGVVVSAPPEVDIRSQTFEISPLEQGSLGGKP
jgi:hypothetical protein